MHLRIFSFVQQLKLFSSDWIKEATEWVSEWDRVQSRKLWNVNWCDNRVQLNGIGIQIGISLSQWLLLLINQLQWESVKAAYKHTAYFAKSNIKGRNDALIWHSLLIINIQLTPLHKDLLLPPSTFVVRTQEFLR